MAHAKNFQNFGIADNWREAGEEITSRPSGKRPVGLGEEAYGRVILSLLDILP
jgi:hypothetical protein